MTSGISIKTITDCSVNGSLRVVPLRCKDRLISMRTNFSLNYLWQLQKPNGVVSLIVPSSLYSDKGSLDLRQVLLQQNDWKFLHAFHNAEGLFDIHRSFKFCIVLIRKGGVTNELMAHFDARNVVEAELTSPHRLALAKLKSFSPKWLSVP